MSSSFSVLTTPLRSRRGVLALAGGGLLLLGGGLAAGRWAWSRGGDMAGAVVPGTAGGRAGRFLGEREVMGTRASLIVAHRDAVRAEEALARSLDAVAAVEARMSRFLPDSDVGRLNGAPGDWQAVHEDTATVLKRALALARAADGRFDPCLDVPMARWGFYRHQPPNRLPRPAELRELVTRGGYRALEVREEGAATLFRLSVPGVGIDLGGIAKGFAVDRAAEVLRDQGVTRAVVNVGDDLRVLGGAPEGGPWRIGVRHPRDPEAVLDVLEMIDGAVATSGDYANAFFREGRRYAHLLDPATGEPSRAHRSMTVQAPTAMDADALATAAFTTPPDAVGRLLARIGSGPWLGVNAGGRIARG